MVSRGLFSRGKGIPMNECEKFIIIGAVAVAGVIAFFLSTSTGQDRRKYKVEAQMYNIPLYQSDEARAVAACEPLAERYGDLAEQSLTSIAADTEAIAARLDAIDAGLASLEARIARIECHLGIAPVTPSAAARPDPNAVPAPAEPTPSPGI